MPARGSKTVSRVPEVATEPPKAARAKPKSFKNPREISVFGLLAVFASDVLLRPRDGPKMAQESPKTGPIEAQDGP